MADLRIPNVNNVIISGRATSDSVLSYTESGSAYLRFRIASNRNYRDRNGEWQEETTFVGVTLWGKAAERLSERIKKGTPVMIQGRLQSYTREVDGFKRTEVSIQAFRTQVLEKRGGGYREEEVETETPEEENDIESPPDDDEELPF